MFPPPCSLLPPPSSLLLPDHSSLLKGGGRQQPLVMKLQCAFFVNVLIKLRFSYLAESQCNWQWWLTISPGCIVNTWSDNHNKECTPKVAFWVHSTFFFKLLLVYLWFSFSGNFSNLLWEAEYAAMDMRSIHFARIYLNACLNGRFSRPTSLEPFVCLLFLLHFNKLQCRRKMQKQYFYILCQLGINISYNKVLTVFDSLGHLG